MNKILICLIILLTSCANLDSGSCHQTGSCQKDFIYRYNSYTNRQARNHFKSPADVNLTKTAFKKIEKERGMWSGEVQGQGKIALYLQISQHNSPIETRFIGQIDLKKSEPPTFFKFRSPLPQVKNWDWKIITSHA